MRPSGHEAPGKSRQVVVKRKGPSRNPWVRMQEELPCRRCGSTPGNQCVTSTGGFARHPHWERYEDAGLATSVEATDRTRTNAATRKRAPALRAALKQQVFEHYGEACACCGATEKLTVDHIHGDGKRHRQEMGGLGKTIHAWLVRNNFPPGFQILCSSCNRSKQGGPYCRLHNQARYEAVVAIIRTVNPGALTPLRPERLAG